MPCFLAKASGSPGSGGRHQQTGGPPPWMQKATSVGPVIDGGIVTGPSPSGLQSKIRCGALASSGWYLSAALAATNTPAAPFDGSRSNGRFSTAANPSSSEGGSSSRKALICEVGACT